MIVLTKENRISRHNSFLNANWNLIAAFAWEKHLKDGRGAVLVPEEDFVHYSTPQYKPLRFHYIPVVAHDKPPFEDILSEKELGWLNIYDPDEKVVLCIFREGGGVSSYFIGGSPKPSDAYAAKQRPD